MNDIQLRTFRQLVRAWKNHDDQRVQGTDIGAMVESRRRLDEARHDMWRVNHS